MAGNLTIERTSHAQAIAMIAARVQWPKTPGKRRPSINTRYILILMERERSCDAVSKLTGHAIQDVWSRVKRWRPDLLGERYIKRSARRGELHS